MCSRDVRVRASMRWEQRNSLCSYSWTSARPKTAGQHVISSWLFGIRVALTSWPGIFLPLSTSNDPRKRLNRDPVFSTSHTITWRGHLALTKTLLPTPTLHICRIVEVFFFFFCLYPRIWSISGKSGEEEKKKKGKRKRERKGIKWVYV